MWTFLRFLFFESLSKFCFVFWFFILAEGVDDESDLFSEELANLYIGDGGVFTYVMKEG